MATIGILSRLQFDAHTRSINVESDDTMDRVAEAAASVAIGIHAVHPDPSQPLRVRFTTDDDSGKPLARDLTVAQAGFRHFDCIDVYVEGLDRPAPR